MTPEQFAQFKEYVANLTDFMDSSIVWFPMYALILFYFIILLILAHLKLRTAKKEIKKLKKQIHGIHLN
jgi:hypothetical protein